MTSFRSQKTLIFAVLANLAWSLPTTPPVSRSNGFDGLLAICPGTLWDGDSCQILEWKSGLCYGVPSNLNGQIQSASPYQGNNGACVLYHERSCLGDGTPPITFPGVMNFETSGLYSPFQSWRCDCGKACIPKWF